MPHDLAPLTRPAHDQYIEDLLKNLPPNHPNATKLEGLKRTYNAEIELSLFLIATIRSIKKARKLTVRDMAKLAGCSPASVSNDLAGRGSIWRLFAYLDALDYNWVMSIHDQHGTVQSLSSKGP